MSENSIHQTSVDQLPSRSFSELHDEAHVIESQPGGLNSATVDEHSRAEVGLLTADEYKLRRSESLNKNPEVELDEQAEICSYFERQDPSYVEQIKALAGLDHPIGTNCRVVVTVPAFNEGSRIRQTLEQYVKQDIDPKLFEIVILDNHPEWVEGDNTACEVERFKDEHPAISIVFAEKIWAEDEKATVGNARRYTFDIGLARIVNRGGGEEGTLLISNDADVISIAPNYLRSILEAFDTTPRLDGLVTKIELPDSAMAKPNVAVAYTVLDELERAFVQEDEKLGHPKEPAVFIGRSSAVRSSIYSAVGGFNPNAVIAEDLELSWMISDARKWSPDRIIQFDKAALTTDPRRHLDAVASGVPIDQMLFDFQQRPELRQMDNDVVLNLISDNLDWELLEDEINSTWHSQYGGNKRVGDKFVPAFRAVMGKIGIMYEVVDGSVKLKNIDKLLENLLLLYDKKIEIIHSTPRYYTPEMIQEIQSFFSAVSKAAVEARQSNKT